MSLPGGALDKEGLFRANVLRTANRLTQFIDDEGFDKAIASCAMNYLLIAAFEQTGLDITEYIQAVGHLLDRLEAHAREGLN